MLRADAIERASAEGLDALAATSRLAAGGGPFGATIVEIARAALTAANADLCVVWLADASSGDVVARAVAAGSTALAGELESARAPLTALGDDGVALAPSVGPQRLQGYTWIAAAIESEGEPLGRLELLRLSRPFDDYAGAVARMAAEQVGLAVQLGSRNGDGSDDRSAAVQLAGDALAAAVDEDHAADRIAWLAAHTTGAGAVLVWRGDGARRCDLVAAHGAEEVDRRALASLANDILRSPEAYSFEALPDGEGSVATLQLGHPPLGALQLVFADGRTPRDLELERLTSFAVRAAHALRATERARSVGLELERSRALLAVLGQAIAQLSLAHTLETAVERVAELVGAERVAVYLEDEGRLTAAAEQGLAGAHELVAGRLLELALGPSRSRGMVRVPDAATDPRLARVREHLTATGIETALALPLVVHGEVIGLLAAFPPRSRQLTANESALLVALSAQLAVAVQNARLHERAKLLGAELEEALDAERDSARRLGALYEISRSFTESLSLQTTLEAVVETVVRALDVDAAVIRMADARGVELTVRALHFADERVSVPAHLVLGRPQPLANALLRRLIRTQEPLLLDPGSAEELGGSHALLAPFLEKSSTAAVVPLATPGEVHALLTIVSFDPVRPIDEKVVDAALAIARQAALAIDNARLYSQQKEFADTMQRSLLPSTTPVLRGLELGDVYESSARVDVGGDVYDYLELGDGRLAVVLGDVTGHGVEATADMAMAKFIFRSLARVHVDPSAFLAAANDVVVGEIAPGKFITMVYMAIDVDAGTLACASAGHPPPRLVLADGSVTSVAARGLALGVADEQEYETVRVDFPPGATVVLYTDGVLEARKEGEQYGEDRFDRLLARRRSLPPKEIALAALDACRVWSGGELTDDFAVVVIKRTNE